VDYADNVTHVLVHGDPLAPHPGPRNPGSHARQPRSRAGWRQCRGFNGRRCLGER
jgi:hypothetical protein